MRAAAGLVVVLLAAIVLVARQPVGSSWARYADADSSYVGSGIGILTGERTRYFDHPGVPLQALAAVSFGGQYALYRLTGGGEGLHAYAAATMLDLDRTRPWFRGWAIVLYLAGAAAMYLLVGRLLRSRLLGVAAGLAWVAAPGIGWMSIQLRPDVLLAAACVILAYLIATGAERRDAGTLALAAVVAGIALTVKVHAAGMLVPLALVTVFRAPADGWWRPDAVRVFVSRHKRALLVAAVVWAALVALLNVAAWPFGPAPSQVVLGAQIAAAVAAFWAVAATVTRFGAPRAVRAVVGLFPALMLTLVLAGLLLSFSLVLSDAGLMVQTMKGNLTGGGANTGIPLLDRLSNNVEAIPPVRLLTYLGLVAAVCVLAYRRRRFWPIALMAGSATLWAMAAGREGGAHYYAPAYVVAVIVALWLVAEGGARVLAPAAVAVAAIGAAVAISRPPDFSAADGCEQAAAEARTLVRPGEVILAARNLSLPDIEYETIVRPYVALQPVYDYDFVGDSQAGLALARERSLRPRYAIGPQFAGLVATETHSVGSAGRYAVTPVYRDAGCGVVSLAAP